MELRVWFVVLASESPLPQPHAFDVPVGIVELTHTSEQGARMVTRGQMVFRIRKFINSALRAQSPVISEAGTLIQNSQRAVN